MRAPEIRRHLHLGDAIEIPDRAVNHQAASLRRLHDVVEEIVADDRAALSLSEQIHDQHVARLQHVDRRLIVHALEAGGLRAGVDDAVEIRPQRHELHGERAADQPLVGMQNLKAVFVDTDCRKLLPPAGSADHTSSADMPARPLDQAVRDLRPAVGEPLERVLRRQLDHLLLGEREQLRVRERGRPGAAAQPRRAAVVDRIVCSSFVFPFSSIDRSLVRSVFHSGVGSK